MSVSGSMICTFDHPYLAAATAAAPRVVAAPPLPISSATATTETNTSATVT